MRPSDREKELRLIFGSFKILIRSLIAFLKSQSLKKWIKFALREIRNTKFANSDILLQAQNFQASQGQLIRRQSINLVYSLTPNYLFLLQVQLFKNILVSSV